MSTDSPTAEIGTGELSDDVVACVKVQENDGTYHVSVPKDMVRELGLEKGDRVVFTGQQGDCSLRLQKSTASLFGGD